MQLSIALTSSLPFSTRDLEGFHLRSGSQLAPLPPTLSSSTPCLCLCSCSVKPLLHPLTWSSLTRSTPSPLRYPSSCFLLLHILLPLLDYSRVAARVCSSRSRPSPRKSISSFSQELLPTHLWSSLLLSYTHLLTPPLSLSLTHTISPAPLSDICLGLLEISHSSPHHPPAFSPTSSFPSSSNCLSSQRIREKCPARHWRPAVFH
jgi:hypothetical protein